MQERIYWWRFLRLGFRNRWGVEIHINLGIASAAAIKRLLDEPFIIQVVQGNLLILVVQEVHAIKDWLGFLWLNGVNVDLFHFLR